MEITKTECRMQQDQNMNLLRITGIEINSSRPPDLLAGVGDKARIQCQCFTRWSMSTRSCSGQ